MMNYQTSLRAFILPVLILLCSPVLAEYKAITKHPRCELIGGSHGCDGVTNPKQLEESLPRGVDEIDIKACEAITDNINEMEKYHVNWNCDFPISANNYLLSKPQWQEVTGDEQCNARKALSGGHISTNETEAQFCKRMHDYPFVGYPYNLDGVDGNEKIYMASYSDFKCGAGMQKSRIEFWEAENDGTSLRKRYDGSYDLNLINEDIVLFSSRIYLIHYYDEADPSGINGFQVTTLRLPYASKGGLKTVGAVCSIKSAETLNSTKKK